MSKLVEQILAKLVSFDTTSRNSNRNLIDYVHDYLRGYGIASDIVLNDNGSKACLWATIGTSLNGGIVLAGHTDVVPVDAQRWTSDPFILIERDGKLFARGSADMKGFIACVLAVVPEILEAKSTTTFHIALTCDEETDMSGAERLMQFIVQQNRRPSWIWIGEPTSLTVVDQHKGVAVYRTKLTGKPYHSSQPDKGINAIHYATKFIDLISGLAHQKKSAPFENSRFDAPYTTFNVGMIAGGSAPNIIPEQCEVTWEVRAHPGDTAVSAFKDLKEGAADFSPNVGVETCMCFDIPPFLPTVDNPGTQTLQQLLKCDQTYAVGFATEAGIFQKLGAPAVVCGPGSIAQAHQPDEYVDKNQLFACVDLIRAVLLSSSAREERA